MWMHTTCRHRVIDGPIYIIFGMSLLLLLMAMGCYQSGKRQQHIKETLDVTSALWCGGPRRDVTCDAASVPPQTRSVSPAGLATVPSRSC